MMFIFTVIVLIFIYIAITRLKHKNVGLAQQEQNIVAQAQLEGRLKAMAATIPGAANFSVPVDTTSVNTSVEALAKAYDRNEKIINILWIVFCVVIAVSAYFMARPWLKILAVIGPSKFIHMLTL